LAPGKVVCNRCLRRHGSCWNKRRHRWGSGAVPTRFAAVAVALVAAWRPRPTIKLRRGEVHVAAAAEEVFERLRSRMLTGGDLVAGDQTRAVVRFSGRAGPFRYRTVEEVHFSGTTVTFRHLQGPFHRCEETLRAEPDAQGGTTVAHEGELAMRGGLVGWLFGLAAVRPVFERHVVDHLRELSSADHSG
jgi:hypothetical protein